MSFFTIEVEVWVLLISCFLPVFFLLVHLVTRKPMNHMWLFFWGIIFILLGGINIVVLRRLGDIANKSLHTWDDVLFGPTYSIAFYVIPLLCAGIGVNLITEVITSGVSLEKNKSRSRDKSAEQLPEESEGESQSPDRPD